jgi:capsular polysaccharide biosynthesis protein
LHPVAASIIFAFCHNNRWRPIVKLNDYTNKFGLSRTQIFDATRVITPAPTVTPNKDQAYLVAPHDHFSFPPVYVSELNNVTVYGGTNLIFDEYKVICHDLYDFERDYTSEELSGRHIIDGSKRRMRLLESDPTPLKMKEAAVFLDACSSNYAHWLTEVLPRIATFCSLEQFADVPIVVDANLHQNMMESLFIIAGYERDIFQLPSCRGISIDKIFITSAVGYVPFERRNKNLKDHSHGRFCAPALKLTVDKITSYATNLNDNYYPKKIFLRRNSERRRILNTVEIEEFIVNQGYTVVEPEKLTFLAQFDLFRKAESIIGPTGATFANLIFSSEKVDCQILIAKYRDISYWYWQNIACSSGKNVSYILGDLTDSISDIHGDFRVNLKNLNEIFKH